MKFYISLSSQETLIFYRTEIAPVTHALSGVVNRTSDSNRDSLCVSSPETRSS